jgi:histidyl-tRNA synthetase
MNIPIPTGVFDILPKDPKETWRNSHLWQYVENVMRLHAQAYACQEIRTPIFERTELFCRSVGDVTDIVSKEMYTFQDKGGRSLSLRPEGTASVMRAFIEKQLHAQGLNHRFFYIGPMFRYERPQSGRFRQHHQLGVEVIGSAQPEVDAELIEMLYSLYEKLGLKHLTVYINSLGDKEARQNFRNALLDYLRPYFEKLSPDSKARLEANPLRILDSKDEEDKNIIKNAPSILDFLSLECKQHFGRVQELLQALQIPFEVNPLLVRGLDYYTRTVFEITSGALGAQNTIGAGGRYDGLMKSLGGQDLPTIGYATGVERIIQTMLHQHIHHDIAEEKLNLYIIPLGESAIVRSFELVHNLRKEGICCYLDTSRKKLKSSMQQADSDGAEFVLVLGDNELVQGVCELKEMKTAEKVSISITAIKTFFVLRNQSKVLKNEYKTMKKVLQHSSLSSAQGPNAIIAEIAQETSELCAFLDKDKC